MIHLQTKTDSSGSDDDSASGEAMSLIFTGAVLIVTGAVALLALVSTWWMLGVAFAIHVIMTTVVILTILYVMDGRAQTSPDHLRSSPKAGRRGPAWFHARNRSLTAP
jgi:membrane protein implicated in regulation of membrane protease activity